MRDHSPENREPCQAAKFGVLLAGIIAWGAVANAAGTGSPQPPMPPAAGDVVVHRDRPIAVGAARPGSGRLLEIRSSIKYRDPYCG